MRFTQNLNFLPYATGFVCFEVSLQSLDFLWPLILSDDHLDHLAAILFISLCINWVHCSVYQMCNMRSNRACLECNSELHFTSLKTEKYFSNIFVCLVNADIPSFHVWTIINIIDALSRRNPDFSGLWFLYRCHLVTSGHFFCYKQTQFMLIEEVRVICSNFICSRHWM